MNDTQIRLNINNKEYVCSVIFTAGDFIEFIRQRNEKQTGKLAIAQSIYNNIENPEDVNISDIMALSDSEIEKYLKCIVEVEYNLVWIDGSRDCYENFYTELLSLCTDSLKEATVEISKKFRDITVNINKNLSSAIVAMLEPLATAVSELSQKIWDSLLSATKQLDEIIKNIHIPEYTDAEIEELKKSYSKWGEFGWTIIPEAPLTLYYKEPIDLKEANRIALKYCNKSAMNNVFQDLRGNSSVKQSDLEEAISCYDNGHYKACSMILFGLIDARLIRLQKKEDYQKGRRATGKNAANNVLMRIDNKSSLLKMLSIKNLLACLEIMFKNGNDFIEQYPVINRHFLDHGMLVRKVKRMDCVQIFLTYYNLIHLLEWA